MSVTRTQVNGIDFSYCSVNTTTNARKFAAGLPRGGVPGIKRIAAGVGNSVDVWVDDEPTDPVFNIPDGWTVDHIHVVPTGSVVLSVFPEESDR